ncbi:MAG: T9SS type A sorting domain-containing protein [Flavipsychrobacter sp.]|nr:T9SS type A sorting domain-containing protein [Flavipsychrobacter sp.]
MKRIATLLLVLLTMQAQAQVQGPVYQFNGGVPVFIGSQQKSAPWCGGFDNPQPAMGDLNGDGKMDMVIFEKEPSQVKTFINYGTPGNPRYEFEPKYIANFPNCNEYLALFDYNHDNIPDLCTHGGMYGFSIYKGYYNGNNELCFTFYRVLIYSNDLTTVPPIDCYVKNSDLPCIFDIDDDGDYDFFSYDANGAFIYFYQNHQVEDGQPSDTIRTKLRDKCWGKIGQGTARTHTMPYSCNNVGLLRSTGGNRHGNNAICIFRADNDSDYDLLDGNAQFSDLQFFRNGKQQTGNAVDTMIFQDTLWQNAYMTEYAAPFYLDGDQDGNMDILVTPRAEGTSENYKTIQLYRNTGTTNNPTYAWQTDTFLVDQTIDIGTGAYPMLYDYDRDGKPDLIVGSDGYYQSGVLRSRLAYYRNTSTGPGSPSFTFQTYNLLNMDTASQKGAAPSAGDLDNDGKDDLIIGQTDGTMTFYTNTAASNAVQPVWSNPVKKIRDHTGSVIMDVGSNAAPFIYDLDKDGKNDLIVGTMLGYFIYYQNVGTVPGQLKLKRVNLQLGGMKVDPQTSWKGHATPFIGKIDDGPTDYLLSGSSSGALYRFSGFQGGDTTLAYPALDSLYSFIKGLGVRTAPTVADIDGDGHSDMIVGTQYGGLLMYRQVMMLSGGSTPQLPKYAEVSIYPNPARDVLNINWNTAFAEDDVVSVSVVNALGQQVLQQSFPSSRNAIQVDIAQLPSGIYFCIATSGTRRSVNTLHIIR